MLRSTSGGPQFVKTLRLRYELHHGFVPDELQALIHQCESDADLIVVTIRRSRSASPLGTDPAVSAAAFSK
jgi:hypothetical protein